jgi:type VI secretion system secreted protein Hcp
MGNWIKNCVVGSAIVGSLIAARPALAAVSMVLKAGDIRGESAVTKHEGEIDVLAWSWGVAQPNVRVGSAATGKAAVNALVITKYVDQASPLLFQDSAQGKVLPQANFVAIRVGGKGNIEFIKIKLENVIVASVSTGKASANDRFTEEVSLVFSAAEYTYVPTKADGSAGAAVTIRWSLGK